MTTVTILSPKDPSEVDLVFFAFGHRLVDGETIISAVVNVTTYAGTDPTPSAIKSGLAAVSGGTVSQRIINGVDGCAYKMKCLASTSTGRVLAEASIIHVKEV